MLGGLALPAARTYNHKHPANQHTDATSQCALQATLYKGQQKAFASRVLARQANIERHCGEIRFMRCVRAACKAGAVSRARRITPGDAAANSVATRRSKKGD